MFQAVIFDMDGVLVNNEPLDFRAWVSILQSQGISVGNDELRSLTGKTTKRVLEYFEDKSGKKLSTDLILQKRKLFYEIAEKELAAMPGVRKFLDTLATRQVPLGVASASEPERIELALTKTGLMPYFQTIASGDSVQNNKPAPDLYLHVANRLGKTPDQCLVIEDSLTGIQAATAAGMTVWGYTSSMSASALRQAGASETFDSFERLSDHFM